jgi:hypothetical protein
MMQISHQYGKSLYCEYFLLITKGHLIGYRDGICDDFFLSSGVIEIKNENQREGFKGF